MTGLAAYVVLVVVVPALLLGHQGQHWPLRRACAWLCARVRPEAPERGARLLRTPERSAESRLWLRAARVPRTGPTATGPSRPHSPRCGAPQAPGGGFPAPATPEPTETRTELSTTEEAA